MPQSIYIIITFIIALPIGIFIGKLLFSSKGNLDKMVFDEQLKSVQNQNEQLKSQFSSEKNFMEKMAENVLKSDSTRRK